MLEGGDAFRRIAAGEACAQVSAEYGVVARRRDQAVLEDVGRDASLAEPLPHGDPLVLHRQEVQTAAGRDEDRRPGCGVIREVRDHRGLDDVAQHAPADRLGKIGPLLLERP